MLNSRLLGIVITIVSLIGLGFCLYFFKASMSPLTLVSLGNIALALGGVGVGIGAIVFPSDPKKGKIINIVGRSIWGLAMIFLLSFVAISMFSRM
jgi:uncharacterized membrane protein